MAAYSFLNIMGAIAGPGGAFNLGSGSGAAEEGITFSNVEEKDLATMGADGTLMHTLRASDLAKCTVNLLKTSPVNALLSAMYNFQKGNPALWGVNVLTVSDVSRGDVESFSQAAFLKPSDNTYDKDGKMMTWEFLGLRNNQLGAGVPDVNV